MIKKTLAASIREDIRARIAAGVWAEKLPSEPDLVKVFDASRETVRKALGMLEAEGLIYRMHGKGTFVEAPLSFNPLAGALSITEELARARHPVRNEVLESGWIPPARISSTFLRGFFEDAPRVFGSDPMRNTVFSVHMYAAYDTREKVEAYLSKFQDGHRLPLIVGEFGMTQPDQVIASHGIMELAEKRRIGTLAWSWFGNNEACRIHDLTEDGERLTRWGEMVVEGPCGIRRTARKASVFD